MVSFCEPYMRKGRRDERDALERLGRSQEVIERCALELNDARQQQTVAAENCCALSRSRCAHFVSERNQFEDEQLDCSTLMRVKCSAEAVPGTAFEVEKAAQMRQLAHT